VEFFENIIEFLFRIDIHLDYLFSNYQQWIYLILFLVIFSETGLVIMAFLPGDALLFIAGTLAGATSNNINIHILVAVMLVAAILGDSVNYFLGKKLGNKLFKNPNSRIFKQSYLERTHRFYEKHGRKTLILARFLPIIRTFAPFVAGMVKMNYRYFLFANVSGAFLWVISLTYAGYFLGTMPFVQENLQWMIIIIIVLANIPAIYEIIKKKYSGKNE